MIPNLLRFINLYSPRAPYVLVYMSQQVEYQPTKFLKWVLRIPRLSSVKKRQDLVLTPKSLFLLAWVYSVWAAGIATVLYLIVTNRIVPAAVYAILLPLSIVIGLALVLWLAWPMLRAMRRKELRRANDLLSRHEGERIAVLGSFGKTTTKEVLARVLSEGNQVAVTPGNMNVAISHARWINKYVTGQEDFLIFEFGEYEPGDIAKLAKLTMPTHAVVAGVAPNHLENFTNYAQLKAEFESIAGHVSQDNIYVHNDVLSEGLFSSQEVSVFSDKQVFGWKITDIESDIENTKFALTTKGKKLKLTSGLIGEHLVPTLAFASAIGLKFGMSETDVKKGLSKTAPFEHRMQPRHLHGAILIDDTYNGNIEGMRAGLQLLAKATATKKIYVTPGLVEQGNMTKEIHTRLGKYIADAKPDIVVLMKNSVCGIIRDSLHGHGFKGELRIEDDPKEFYDRIGYELAAGDLVLMQNDWTDNYN